ncbi:glycosyltransferase [Streptomyces minutiscleroticus]|uniref:Glycosyltransferase 2-like domain-containing protein n=1 Tax=Streptomyces minutiscleroticus TaxID=68238 RepID=A0A918U477_9ACTN|nr:glycosyltransferase [Streptomyces minutiscleroticus]GGX90027.1 hypothetical protein GCM10010358_50050 [Streptomyces minutiscleroticus]
MSIVAAAHDEEPTVVESVRAMLALRHPRHEVVVVDDGSRDGTFRRLAEVFDLRPVERVQPGGIRTGKPATAVHASADSVPLVVVRKENSGRAAFLNVGIDLASIR